MPKRKVNPTVKDVVVPESVNPIVRLIKDIVANEEDDRINDTFVVANCANEICNADYKYSKYLCTTYTRRKHYSYVLQHMQILALLSR